MPSRVDSVDLRESLLPSEQGDARVLPLEPDTQGVGENPHLIAIAIMTESDLPAKRGPPTPGPTTFITSPQDILALIAESSKAVAHRTVSLLSSQSAWAPTQAEKQQRQCEEEHMESSKETVAMLACSRCQEMKPKEGGFFR